MSVARCPACADTLVADHVDGSEVRACRGCAGTWIGAADLHAFVQPRGDVTTVGGLSVEHVEQGSRTCPWCAGPLRTAREQSTGTQVDWCDRHGIWLDARELDVLRGLERPPVGAAPGERRGRGLVAEVAWFFGGLFV